MHIKYFEHQFSVNLRYCETAEVEADTREGRVEAVNIEKNIGL